MKKLIYLHGQKEDPDVTHIDFPTGEKHIRIRNLTPTTEPILFYNDPSGDVMKLGMAVDICRRAGVRHITLVIPFVPYARQDRVAVDGDPFSIQVFARFVNSLDIDRVVMTDPHSEVTPALIDNAVIIHQHEVAEQAITAIPDWKQADLALVAPDLGAAKKIKALQQSIFKRHDIELPVIQCDKTRCVETGQIRGFKVLDGDPTGKHCLMVDDICDGGGTFLGLAQVLAHGGAVKQSLFVTHGIFSKGTDILFNVFDSIYCTDSFGRANNSVFLVSCGAYA